MKTQMVLLVAAMLIIVVSPVIAGKKINLKTLTFGGLGFLSSYYLAHEGSHLIYATITNVEGFRFTSVTGNWWADEPPSTALRLAGLTGQALYSEGILAFTKRKKRGPFLHGALLTNAVWEIAYPWLRGPDFNTLSNTAVNISKAIFTSHGLLTLWRAYLPKPPKSSFLDQLNLFQNTGGTGIIFTINF